MFYKVKLIAIGIFLILSLFLPHQSLAEKVISASAYHLTKVKLNDKSSYLTPLHIHTDSHNTIWLVFDRYVVKKQGNKSKRYLLPGEPFKYLTGDRVIRSITAFDTLLISYNKQLIYYNKRIDNFVNWHNYPEDSDIIRGMATNDKTLWITTESGVYKLTGLKSDWQKIVVPEHLLPKIPETIPTIAPINIIALTKNQFIIGGFFSSVYKMTIMEQKVNFEKFDLPDNVLLHSLVKVSAQLIIIGTDTGLYEFDLNTNKFGKMPSLYENESISDLIYHNKLIWMMTSGDLYNKTLSDRDFSPVNISPTTDNKITASKVLTYHFDQEGSLWLSLENEGLFYHSRYINKLERLTIKGLTDEVSPSFFGFDHAGQALISSRQGTLIPVDNVNSRKSGKNKENSNITYPAKGNTVGLDPILSPDSILSSYSIVPVATNTYLVGDTKGTYLVKNNNIGMSYQDEKSAYGDVTSQGVDNLNRIWQVKNNSGLSQFDLVTGAIYDYDEGIKKGFHKITYVAQHDINKITLIDDNEIKTLEISQAQDRVIKTIKLTQRPLRFERKDNYLFIHHNDLSISRYELTSLILENFSFPEIDNIGCVYNNGDDNWWLAQKGGALYHINWLTKQHRVFGQADGIPEGGLNGDWCEENAGKLYFSSYQGFVRTSENIDSKNEYIADISINAITDKNNQDLSRLTNKANQILTIKSESFPITIDYANNSQVYPDSNQHRYQLKGLNADWVDVNDKNLHISYQILAPGDYTLLIQGSNNEGLWGNISATELKVLSPVWLTWWAKMFYLFVSTILLWFVYRLRTRTLRQRALALEHMVSQRTVQLVQKTEELVKEKLKVEELLSTKNEEFANISHEFRTPLTLILGPVKRLQQAERLNDCDKSTLDMVKRNGFRLLRMVDQLLHLEKFRVQQITTRTAVQVKPIANLIGQSFQDLALEKKICLTIKQLDDVWLLFTPDALEKILLNLLSNALKYSRPGDSIELSIVNSAKKVNIVVRDTGIGIAKPQQVFIFGRFNRVFDDHSEQIAGAGIGLALVQELVNSHGGTITLVSELNQGATFTVELPQYLPNDNEKAQHSALTQANPEMVELELESLLEQKNQQKQAQNPLSQLDYARQSNDEMTTILVVEDNPDMRDYILSVLTNDYQVLLANNGKQGVEIATDTIPDLIISDVMMPQMDGFTLCRTLKSQVLTSHIPLILLTARIDRDSRLQGWKDQADEYLTKPFDSEELLLRIKNLLIIRDLLKESFYQKALKVNSPQFNGDHVTQQLTASVADTDEWQGYERQFIEKFIEKIELNITNPGIKVDEIASSLAMSERQLYRKLKGVLNVTPKNFLQNYRLEKAHSMLKNGDVIGNVMIDVGFSSSSYFARCFKAKYGKLPSEI